MKNALLELAQFLTSSEGRTTAHLTAVDHFFCDWDELWTGATEHLPQQIKDVFKTIGIDLHGGLDQPEYHTTPEQLLEMVRKL